MRDDRLFLHREYVSASTNVDSNKVDSFRDRKNVKKQIIPNQAFLESLEKYRKVDSYKTRRLEKLKEYGMIK
jgi:hypothetical protein